MDWSSKTQTGCRPRVCGSRCKEVRKFKDSYTEVGSGRMREDKVTLADHKERSRRKVNLTMACTDRVPIRIMRLTRFTGGPYGFHKASHTYVKGMANTTLVVTA